jgi:hypothetical protein
VFHHFLNMLYNIYLCFATQQLPVLNEMTLILLGISVGTTAGASVIDNSQTDRPQHQSLPSQGFWKDILSDASGISIHRFQMVVWTIVFGVVFIALVVREVGFPHFEPNVLLLMGISSGTYLLLKNGENKKPEKKETIGTISSIHTSYSPAESEDEAKG